MGIAQPETEPNRRSKLASAAFTAIGLVFFFGVGLAGGAAYKIYFSDDGGSPQIADKASTPPAAPAAPPEQKLTATTSSATENAAEKGAPDTAPVEASAPPAPASPAAPIVADQPGPPSAPAETTEPAMKAQAAAPPASSAPESAPPAAASEPQAAPEAASTPTQPGSEAAMQAAAPQPAPAMQEKPAAVKAHRPAAAKDTAPPQTAATHPPPTTQGTVGHFRVQFGAFANEENARRVQWAIEATGLKVVVSHDQGASGNPLFIVRSPSYPDRAAALSAAQTVQSRAKHLVNPIAIDYAIIPDRASGEQHAER